jgi:Hint domain
VSDSTYQWNGGTGSAGSASNWTLAGGVANGSGVPDADDSLIITGGDVQFTDTPIPGPNNGATGGGTVTWQGGEIDMINSGAAGGTAAVVANTLIELTNSVAAVGTLTSSGTANNSGIIDSDANGTMTLSVLSGTLTNLGTVEALNGGSLTIGGSGTFANGGTVVADTNGHILVNATLSGTTSYWSMGPTSGGTIEINTPVASSQNNIFDFPGGGELKLDQLATFGGTVFEPGTGDVVDIGMANVGTLIVSSTGNPNGTASLTLENPTGATLGSFFLEPFTGDTVVDGTFTYGSGGSANDPQVSFSGGGGSDTLMTFNTSVSCFMPGTRIARDHGEVAVEDLQVGDTVKTIIGGKPEQIVWIGQRTIDCSRHPQPKQVWPVRIAAGAFGRGKPSRDLWLSPDHAVYVEDVLIPVKHLINGSSIAQVPRTSVTYYHIELRHHDVVLANGMTAETFLAGANDGVFADKGGPVALHPDMSSRLWEAEGCAPLVVTGPALEAARQHVKLPGRAAPSRRRAKAA